MAIDEDTWICPICGDTGRYDEQTFSSHFVEKHDPLTPSGEMETDREMRDALMSLDLPCRVQIAVTDAVSPNAKDFGGIVYGVDVEALTRHDHLFIQGHTSAFGDEWPYFELVLAYDPETETFESNSVRKSHFSESGTEKVRSMIGSIGGLTVVETVARGTLA